MREGCGLFTLAEWVSSVCKDSASPWWDPHSPLDIWEVLSVIPADSKQGKTVLMVFGEDGDFNHCEPQREVLFHPSPSVWPKQTWHKNVNGCWKNYCFSIISINSWMDFMWCLDSHTYDIVVFCQSLDNIMWTTEDEVGHSFLLNLNTDLASKMSNLKNDVIYYKMTFTGSSSLCAFVFYSPPK